MFGSQRIGCVAEHNNAMFFIPTKLDYLINKFSRDYEHWDFGDMKVDLLLWFLHTSDIPFSRYLSRKCRFYNRFTQIYRKYLLFEINYPIFVSEAIFALHNLHQPRLPVLVRDVKDCFLFLPVPIRSEFACPWHKKQHHRFHQ